MGRKFRAASTVTLVLALSALHIPAAHAVVNTSPKSTWQANGRVSVILRVGNTIYIGGKFTSLFDHKGHSLGRSHLAALDASTGNPTSWDPDPNGNVLALAVSPDGTTLYVGGEFHKIAGSSRQRVAAFSTLGGLLKPEWKASVGGGAVRAIAVNGSKVFIAGAFTDVDGRSRERIAALEPLNGDVDGWYPGPVDGMVRALTLPSSDRLVLGGEFTHIGGNREEFIGAVDASSGDVEQWSSHPPQLVITLANDGAGVYAGTRSNHAIRFVASTGNWDWGERGDGNVQAVTVLGGILYVGGHFSEFNGHEHRRLVAFLANSGSEVSWNAETNSVLGVFAMAGNSSNGDLYIGGDFTKVSSRSQARFAILEN